jgi:hypothetical protein
MAGLQLEAMEQTGTGSLADRWFRVTRQGCGIVLDCSKDVLIRRSNNWTKGLRFCWIALAAQ